MAAAFALLPVEEEEEVAETETEDGEFEFEFEVVFDEEVKFEVPFDEADVVELDVLFTELDEPRRAIIGIPSVASEIAEAIAPF